MTVVLQVDREDPDAGAIARAADCLRRGGLVAFPTETVYGLGAHALDRAAVRRLFEVKGRPANDPVIVHVASLEAAVPLIVDVPPAASRLAARFWPGPLTMVLRRTAIVPDEVSAGLETVAIRVPQHAVALALLRAASVPVAAPSANQFSRPSPTRASHVLEDLEGRIDMVLDAGPTTIGVESTVVDLTTDPPMVLRPGGVTLEMLRTVVPSITARPVRPPADHEAMPSPGLLSRHYSPRAPLTVYRGDAARATAALEADAGTLRATGRRVGVLSPADVTAPRLYAALRELDAIGVDVILAVDPGDDEGLHRAVRDRLTRAAATVVTVE